MIENFYIGIVVFVAALGTYLMLRRMGGSGARQYEQEIESILTSEEHKVKGRFE